MSSAPYHKLSHQNLEDLCRDLCAHYENGKSQQSFEHLAPDTIKKYVKEKVFSDEQIHRIAHWENELTERSNPAAAMFVLRNICPQQYCDNQRDKTKRFTFKSTEAHQRLGELVNARASGEIESRQALDLAALTAKEIELVQLPELAKKLDTIQQQLQEQANNQAG